VLDSLGERRVLSAVESRLAETVYRQGRYDEPGHLTKKSEELTGSGDIASRIERSLVRAKLVARRGEFERAERLAREALRLGRPARRVRSWHRPRRNRGAPPARTGRLPSPTRPVLVDECAQQLRRVLGNRRAVTDADFVGSLRRHEAQ
jgi:hypothetical protein